MLRPPIAPCRKCRFVVEGRLVVKNEEGSWGRVFLSCKRCGLNLAAQEMCPAPALPLREERKRGDKRKRKSG